MVLVLVLSFFTRYAHSHLIFAGEAVIKSQISDGHDSLSDGLCEQLRSLDINDDIDECSLLLGDAPPEEIGWTLSACLRAFTAAETLSAPNAYECEKCCLPYNKKVPL